LAVNTQVFWRLMFTSSVFRSYEAYSQDTLIDDVLYGLGAAIQKEDEHEFANGFEEFKRNVLIPHVLQWLPIQTAPTREDEDYMVLCGIGDDQVAVEVSNFEGNRYPNRHDANVDFEDRIESATHWMPCASLPNARHQLQIWSVA
jgi:hypothetical protein